MNINRKLCTKLALVLLGFSPIFWNINSAHAITSNLNLTPDMFSDGGGTIDNAARFDGNINSTSPSEGFGNVFDNIVDSEYLLLGADDADVNISDSPKTGDSIAFTTDTFDITSTNITNGITIEFDWAFQGTETGSKDEFTVELFNTDTSEIFEVLSRESPNYGSQKGESVLLKSLTPGAYQLGITLSEAGAFGVDGNTAAGFDNITVAVPFEFSPSLGLLLMGGLFGGHAYLKRRRSAANVNFD